jgi:hypothetical protein
VPVSTVDDRQRTATLLDHDRGHEVFVADAAGHRPVEVGHDRPQVGALERDVPVRAEHDARQPDRVQTLAADVADDHPDAVRRVERLVQVAADVGRGAGGDVPAGDGQRAHLRAERAQHGLLGDRGEPGQLGDPFGLPLANRRDAGRDDGGQDDAADVYHRHAG